MQSCRVRVDGGVSLAGEVADLVGELADKAGLTSRQAYSLRLATDEITTNIVHHGYRGGPGVVDLTAGFDDQRAWVRIEDDAPEFDPRCYEPPTPVQLDPATRPMGGCGLLLALNNVDEFSYQYSQGRNCNTMAMVRRAKGAQDGR